MICETIRTIILFSFKPTSFHSISTLRLLCNLLDPHAKNPNYTFQVRACAVNFSSLIYSLFPSLFFCALFLAGRGFRKIPEVQEVHFKAFQWACETRVSLEYFLVKVTLFVAHFLVYVSLNGAYLGMVSKILSPCTS